VNLISLYLGNTVLLSSTNAAKILELLKDAHCLEANWGDDSVKISSKVDYTFTAFSAERKEGILKAQILGMTYKEYLDAQRESKESIQKDKGIFT
jgi:hypothetical protein